LRHWTRASEGFFEFYRGKNSPALAAVYNADFSQGRRRLLFAINPTLNDAVIPLAKAIAGSPAGGWRQHADQERFYPPGEPGARMPVEAELSLPPLGCGLWISEVFAEQKPR
jgi:hypothetical protein